ncbi:hypothetical protein APHAL10511_006295 [Amanita phalloides]|nr:hypothetical protein APHAL10511_006295 [Amanita phalloides]
MIQAIVSGGEGESYKLREIRASSRILTYVANVDNIRKAAEAFACTDPRHVRQFLALFHKLGYQHKQNVYECVCFRLANLNHWPHILDVVSLGVEQSGRTTSRLLNWKARSLLELKHYGLLSDVLKEFKLYDLKATRRTYHLILSGHLRNCDMTHARHCLREMEEAGFPPDPSTQALLATNYRFFGSDVDVQSRALRTLEDMDNASSIAVLNSLIQSSLDVHDISAARLLLSYFAPSSIQGFAPALSAITQPAEAVNNSFSQKLSHPSDRILMPNASTYAIIINHLASRIGIDGILVILRAMKKNGVKATPALIISLIRFFTAAGYNDVAVKLIAGICDQRSTPWSIFAPLVLEVRDIRLPIDCTGIQPSAALFNALLADVLRTRGLKAMSVILKAMQVNGISPNSATLDILVSYLSKRNVRPRLMLRILRKLVSSAIPPTTRHFHSIISSVLRYEKYLLHGSGWNVGAARFSRSRHVRRQTYPWTRITSISDVFDPTAGLWVPRHSGYRSLARSIIGPLSAHQIKSDAATFALRIRHDAVIKSDTDSAENIFRTLLNRGIRATEYHYSALMEGYALSGDMDKAEALFRKMECIGLKPNIVMYTILITGYGRGGKPEMSFKAFRRMIDDGCLPDVPAIDALCGAFFASGAYGMTKTVLINCWDYIQPFPADFHSLSLRELATRFRSLHNGNHSVPMKLSKRQRRLLHFITQRLVQVWKSMSRTSIP